MTRFSGWCSACPLLPDVLPELHKLSCFLVEPGLHLADLLELCVLTPHKDVNARHRPRGIAALRHTKVVAFVETP
jgi:hypothetical protein